MATTTLLEAVNHVLAVAGELPVTTVDEEDVTAIGTRALAALDTARRAILSEGWEQNSLRDYGLLADVDGHVTPPANTMRLDATYPGYRYTIRNGYVYDLIEKTSTFTSGSTIYVDLQLNMDFVDLSEALAQYVMETAAYAFRTQCLGEETDRESARTAISLARQRAQAEDTDVGNYVYLDHEDTIERYI